MKKQSLFIRGTLFAAILTGLFFLLYKSGISVSDLSPQLILELAHNNLTIVILIMILLMFLQNLFTFIPLILVITINIALFGFWRGYFFSTFSSVIGSTSIFLSIRYFFANLFSSEKLKKYEQQINQNSFLFVLSGRILPFLPTNLINIVSGLSKMKISYFISATTIGNMIYGLVLASVSYGVVSVSQQYRQLFYVIIATVAIIVAVRFIKKQRTSSI
ncbi:TVP38/TMEM64 family protein [Solibacillus sp. NPDC093137]|uniref:TVP38/TMEM64 family protein n=1 Tax=Solibacillus sp. NPDC093137 TaxID=3390678 RepID=UPI003D05A596